MKSRTVVASAVAALAVVVLVGVLFAALGTAFAPFATAGDEPRTFDGWIVVQDGEEQRFPESDGWRGLPLRDGFQLARIQETVTFYGCFRAERLQSVAPDHARSSKADAGDGWSVRQAGEVRTYARPDGWVGRGNPDGYYLEQRGRSVWYYGTFRVVEHPKDDTDLRRR